MAVSSDSVRVAIAAEATPGVAPAGNYDLLRITGEGLDYSITTTTSDEIGGLNRGVKDDILTGATVTGDVAFELSRHKALEDLMAAVHGNRWASDPLTVPGADGDNVYDASIMDTFTIEKRFTLDDTPTYDYHLFTGCMVDTMTISITPNEPITGSFGFVGQEMATASSEAGATYDPAGTNPVMTAPLVTGIELLSPPGIDDTTGAPLGSPVAWAQNGCFTGLDLNFANNGRGLQCIGELGNTETVLGRFEVSSSASMYYNGPDPLDALIARTEYALRVTCTDETGNSFTFLFPRVKISEANAMASGTNTDVMSEMSLQMLEYEGNTYAITSYTSRLPVTPAPPLTATTDTKKKDD